MKWPSEVSETTRLDGRCGGAGGGNEAKTLTRTCRNQKSKIIFFSQLVTSFFMKLVRYAFHLVGFDHGPGFICETGRI